MIEEFVSRSFALRDAAHLAHWATRSYSEHVALGEFYDGLLDKVDTIVEAYQGCFGLIGFFISFIPASCGSLFPFLLLQSLQLMTQFSQDVLPPLDLGITWSMVAVSLVRFFSQYWH